MPVFVAHVVNHAFAPGVGHINIQIRHAHAVRVQKAFKQQFVLNGVHARNIQAVRHQRAGARTAAGPYRNAVGAGPVDEVLHDEEVAVKPHGDDDVKFVFQLLPVVVRHVAVHFFGQALAAQIFKVFGRVGELGRNIKFRQNKPVLGKFQIALFGNFQRVGAGFGRVGKKGAHFFGRFEIQLVGHLHPFRVVKRFTRSNAHVHVVRFPIFLLFVVAVVGGHHGDAGALGHVL